MPAIRVALPAPLRSLVARGAGSAVFSGFLLVAMLTMVGKVVAFAKDAVIAAKMGTADDLDAFMHLWAINRGILLTPFHNMALFSPFHVAEDVDRHTAQFDEALTALTGR